MIKLLHGHTSADTAYLVKDYPYGFRLRCQIRYWLETNKHGTRLVSQTTNPKRGDVWNKPKTTTYCRGMAVLLLDGEGHVQWDTLDPIYSSGERFALFRRKYDDQLSPAQLEQLRELEKVSRRHNPSRWAEWDKQQLFNNTTNPVLKALINASESLA